MNSTPKRRLIDALSESRRRPGDRGLALTNHARQKMAERRITELEVDTVLNYGRVFYKDGARIFTVGRREAASLPLSERQRRSTEGIQVVVSNDGSILTVYRNRNLHKLRVIAGVCWRRPRLVRRRSAMTEGRDPAR
jgi:hypothetical protein